MSSQTSDYYQFRDCAPKSPCKGGKWLVGDGNGKTEKLLGAGVKTHDECVKLVKAKAPDANSATFGFGKCFAEWGSPGTTHGSAYEHCLFDNPTAATTKKPVPVTTKKPANVCSCANGSPKTGAGCTKHGAAMCATCKAGFTISTDKTKCSANTCSCANGSPKTGAACTKNGAAMCASCKAGYAISTDKTKCLDVNPCAKNNGGCHTERKCTHSGGKATCGTCSPGWVNVGATSCKRQCYFFVARGLSGPDVTWLGIESSVPKCAAKVLRNPRCTKDYFSYLLRSNKNCGCKTKSGPLKVISSQTSDYYRIGDCP